VRGQAARGATGTYLRVVVPGEIKAGDCIEVIRRPRHAVTIGRPFRALTTEAGLLPSLLGAGDDLPAEERAAIQRRSG
jgi:MOSC domain-containing protein YiiM